MPATIAAKQMTANRICSETWQRQDKLSHQMRKSKVTSCIDNSSPPVYKHLINRAKKEQLQEERYMRIEHENKLLLQKMSNIMRTSSMDNLQNYQPKLSLNQGVRKKELKKIMDDNAAILKRIQMKKPFYTKSGFDDFAQQHAIYRQRIQEQPTKYLPGLVKDKRVKSAPKRGAVTVLKPIKARSPRSTEGFDSSPGKGSPGSHRKKDPNRVSKGGYNIAGTYMIVTIEKHKTEERTFFKFLTYDMDSGKDLECEVDKDVVEPLLEKIHKRDWSDALVPRLFFKEDGGLDFNSDPAFAPPAASPKKGARSPKNKKSPRAGKKSPAAKAAGKTKSKGGKASESQLSLTLKVSDGAESLDNASLHLFAGDTHISKTEAKPAEPGASIDFAEAFDLEVKKSASLQLRLHNGGLESEALATADFKLDDLTMDAVKEISMNENFTVAVTMTAAPAKDVSIDLDE